MHFSLAVLLLLKQCQTRSGESKKGEWTQRAQNRQSQNSDTGTGRRDTCDEVHALQRKLAPN